MRRDGGHGAGEPAAHDHQIGQIFRNMRTATRLTRDAIARRLATSPATIEDLEMGAVSALPHWPETVRIVRGYCELLRLDPEPLLWRIQQLLRNGGNSEQPPTRPPGPPPPALRKERSRTQAPRRSGRGVRRLLILSTPPALVAALALWASAAPAPLYRAISLLPPVLATPARAALDTFVLYSASRRDGLRWIDVGDPRLRKVDKLPTKPR